MNTAPLLVAGSCLVAVVVALADGRRALAIAIAGAGLALAPATATVAGSAAWIIIGVAVLAIGAGAGIKRVASRAPWTNRLDPTVPLYAPPEPLFGPRAQRVGGTLVMVPIASWVSFAIPAGPSGTVSGLLFPVALIGLVAALRIFLARNIQDLAVGLSVGGLSAGAAFMIESGTSRLAPALVSASLAIVATMAVGWMRGRHARHAHAPSTGEPS